MRSDSEIMELTVINVSERSAVERSMAAILGEQDHPGGWPSTATFSTLHKGTTHNCTKMLITWLFVPRKRPN